MGLGLEYGGSPPQLCGLLFVFERRILARNTASDLVFMRGCDPSCRL